MSTSNTQRVEYNKRQRSTIKSSFYPYLVGGISVVGRNCIQCVIINRDACGSMFRVLSINQVFQSLTPRCIRGLVNSDESVTEFEHVVTSHGV